MKTNPGVGIGKIGAMCLLSFFSCNNVASIRHKTTAANTRTDSVAYTLTVDSVSVPIRLHEIGDFPAHVERMPYRFAFPAHAVNFRDTKYLHFLNGQMIDGRQKERILRKLKETDIASVVYIPAEQAVQDYGQRAAHGIVFIETRNKK
jgi:hypothetical protein